MSRSTRPAPAATRTPRKTRGGRPVRRRTPAATARPPAREALLAAAAELFSERGPAAVSTRQVAARAAVNNGLIHRHFGTKDALVRESLDRLSHEIAAARRLDDDDPASLLRYLEATRERSSYWRLLARCLLDGMPVDTLQSEFPTVREIVDLVRRLQDRGTVAADVDPRIVGAVLTALGLGWLVFEPWLRRGAGLEAADDERFQREARRIIATLLR